MKKLLIIDGNSIINRAFYAIRNLSTRSGLNTNGIYGFLNIMTKTMQNENTDYTVVAFDMRAKTFRHKIFEGCKAQRKGMPPELAEQMPVLHDVLDALGISWIEQEGYEADDLIGTVSKICDENGIICRILTGDRDDLQLVSENTNVLLTVTAQGKTDTVCYDPKAVFEKYGVKPEALIEVKGLMGDSSDNIPGVAGIGEKTALSLISKYKTLDGVYENLSDMKGALLTKLENGRESAFMSRELGKIVRDVPISYSIEDFSRKPYSQDLVPLFKSLEFTSFLNKLDLNEDDEKVEIAVKAETGNADLSLIGDTFYFETKGDDVLFLCGEKFVQSKTDELSAIFENKGIKKITNNAKDEILALSKKGINLSNLAFDTAIAAYVINPQRTDFSLSALTNDILNKNYTEENAVCALPELHAALDNEMRAHEQSELYYKIELPLISVLADMQKEGFKADSDMLKRFSELLSGRAQKLEEEIFELAGEEFNINSPKQLGIILFEKMQLPIAKKTKTVYSTNVDILEKLKSKHEIAGKILEYRHLTKLKSTYADGLLTVINEKTGRIHSSFNQTVTATGRISSTNPNLQNIPVRTDLGREFRKVFVARDDNYILVDADYSQIELRVLAAVADDKNMQKAFKSGVDIHTKTASEVFGVADFMVTDEMRRRAKAVNFGIVYGIGEFSLAQDIGVTRKEAKEYIERNLKSFDGVSRYMKDIVVFAKKYGYVKTLLGRRRYIPEINSSNHMVKAFGERVALNAPIQGTAADIIKLAMVNVYRRLSENNMKSKLILQVHDELIIEAHKSELEEVKNILREEMENAFPLSVPLKVDMGYGRSWYDAK